MSTITPEASLKPSAPQDDPTSLLPKRLARSRPLFDREIVIRALRASPGKLNPVTLMKNPVMFVVEAGGKAQADSLRKTKTDAPAKRISSSGQIEQAPASALRSGDIVLCDAGDLIPGDGEVIEGIATVDESVITGESAPVIRESGGDRSAVTGGTKVTSDQIKIRITSNPGETFLDRMIALVEGAERQKTPNEVALNIQ